MEGSQDNILTTVDTITLQSDMIYTAQVSFNNLDGEFNITTSTNFSKWRLSCDFFSASLSVTTLFVTLGSK